MKTTEQTPTEEINRSENIGSISFNITLSAESCSELIELLGKKGCHIYFSQHTEDDGSCRQEIMERKATQLLKSFLIPANTKGYRYLRDAVIIAANSPELMGKMTRNIYPEIARVHNTTSVRVERVIRHAIENSCSVGDMEYISSFFPRCNATEWKKPTNAEFIAVLSDELRFSMSK